MYSYEKKTWFNRINYKRNKNLQSSKRKSFNNTILIYWQYNPQFKGGRRLEIHKL